MIVLDASAAVAWLLGSPESPAIEHRISDPGTTLHAPHILSVEVAQVLRRHDLFGNLSSTRATEAVEDLADLDVIHHPHEPLLPLIWKLRQNLTAYDAAYVALAMALDAPLLTLDARIARAPHGAVVDLVD